MFVDLKYNKAIYPRNCEGFILAEFDIKRILFTGEQEQEK